MYSFETRIRYSETDKEGKLTLASLLDYFQDCSTFHSEDLGVGMKYLKEKNMVWVLSAWQIEMERFPEMAEHVTVGTFPYEFKGCFGYRNFFMQDKNGAYLAKANTMWTILHTENFRPAHPTEEMIGKYKLHEKLEMHYAGRKIDVPADGEGKERMTVMPWHLDSNNHVNNVQYVRMASSFLPEDFVVKGMRAQYKKQAYLGDVLHSYVAFRQGGNGQEIYVISLRDEKDEVYVNVEFEGK